MALLLQLFIAGVWASVLVINTRRLFRLACVEQLRRWQEVRFSSGMKRIWWWLGQEEFWSRVRVDSINGVQVTLMIFLVAWGTR
ncbi:MAG: hypothetical protein MUD01_27435, partial [Chloroflexaceae bacterium]|nr:hypothetical protein [Chloroflexaceae bacterium]